VGALTPEVVKVNILSANINADSQLDTPDPQQTAKGTGVVGWRFRSRISLGRFASLD
jgi:hypothetical protein